MGTPGQCREKTRMPSRLTTVQNTQNLMTAEPRSLSLFTKKPPRKVPPPPAATPPPAPEASAESPQAVTRTFVEA
uniref:Uncharacterized protein n=1 Tax=Piliocolobus tephrosceles TaxID=591936 RepID=A0A8C9GC51_9PRIM